MSQAAELQRRMDREALTLGARITKVFDTLEQLRRLTRLLFRQPVDASAIDAWLQSEAFVADETGFFRSASQLDGLRRGLMDPEGVTMGWAANLVDDATIRAHLFALHSLGPDLASFRKKIKGCVWIYYQDVKNACCAHPPTDIAKLIPADFDWNTYHTYQTAGPEVNPERNIRWTKPNIDYGGEGLIITASIPIWIDNAFQGLWCVDISVAALIGDNLQHHPGLDRIYFICDDDGNILSHPEQKTLIDKEKGAIIHKTLADLGGDFATLDIAEFASRGQGQIPIVDGNGGTLLCAFQSIPEIGWTLLSTCPFEKPLDSAPQFGMVATEMYVPRNNLTAASIPELSRRQDQLHIGSMIDGKYRIDGQLGSGGFGVVYRATHTALERPVAVKILRPDWENDAETQLRRFRREGLSACRVRHPNAVLMLDLGVLENGSPYLVMELLEGTPLRTLISKSLPIDLSRALSIASDVASVLAAAHAAGIVHRDIKPDNVFLHDAGGHEIVKVLDFGLAKLVTAAEENGRENLTATGQIMGTPLYMAPEQVTGSDIGPRTDVYALGVLMFELIAGEPPFTGGSTPWAVLMHHLSQAPPPLASLRPDVPIDVAKLVDRMLAKTATDRPSAAEVVQILANRAN